MDQWNRIESPEINPDMHGNNLQQRRQKYKMGKRQSLENWSAACKSMKLEHTLTPCTHTKKTSKWLKDLNITHDTIKLLEENPGKTFSDINPTHVFLGKSPKAIEIKNKNKPMGPNQTYKLLHNKRNHKQNTKTSYGMEKNTYK